MNDKKAFRIVMILSVIVFVAVLVLNKKVLPVPEKIPGIVYQLPFLNALINGTCSVLLVCSFIAIRNKKVRVHKMLNLSTFILSSIFLLSYITYHWLAIETRYPEGASGRTVYLIILASHIILAAAVLPIVLMSFYYGITNNIQQHRRLTRFSFPVWLYVTITGVIVYLMISPYYTYGQ